MKISKKARNKRQKMNKEIRAKYEDAQQREDYIANTNDITNWNSMIRDLEEDMKMMERYLDLEDRHYLHKEYLDMKSMIYNQKSYEGIVPIEGIFDETTPDVADIVTRVELQEEIVRLLNDVLTDRQRQVVEMYFWKEMTQDEIGELLGMSQQAVGKNILNSLETLRKHINIKEIVKFFKN